MSERDEVKALIDLLGDEAIFEERARPFHYVIKRSGKYNVNGEIVFLEKGFEFESELPMTFKRA